MLFERIERILRPTIKHYAFWVSKRCGIEFDDAKQEILIKIYQTMREYDQKRGEIKTFFVAVIRNFSFELVKEINNKKILAIQCEIDLLSEKYKALSEKYEFVKKIESKALCDRIERCLEGVDREVFRITRDGTENFAEIGEILSISRQNVGNIWRRKIIPKIRQIMA